MSVLDARGEIEVGALRTFVKGFCFAGALVLAFLAAPSASGYPTSVHSMPTACPVDAGSVVLETGNSGYTAPLRGDSVTGLMSQLGVAPSLEIGVDGFSDSDTSQTLWNARLMVARESERLPGLAVGMMDISRGSRRTLYLVMSRTLGGVMGHVGWADGDSANGLMLGADADINDRLWLGVDYMHGTYGYTRIGFSYTTGTYSYITVSYGVPDSRDSSDPEVSITLSRVLNLTGDPGR